MRWRRRLCNGVFTENFTVFSPERFGEKTDGNVKRIAEFSVVKKLLKPKPNFIMKKIIPIFFIALSIIYFSSCNGGSTPSTETDSKKDTAKPKNDAATIKKGSANMMMKLDSTKSGAGNFYIDKDTADKMIAHFNSYFHQNAATTHSDMKSFIDSDWIDIDIINAYSTILNDASSPYDGIWITNGASSFLGIIGKSNVLLVPTIKYGTGHSEKWGKIASLPSSSGHEFKNFNININDAKRSLKSFRKKFRKQSNTDDPNTAAYDKLTAKVWIDRQVLQYISTLTGIDGIRIYFAAYDWINPLHHNYQKYDTQSTIILVPTNKNRSKHDPNWNIVKQKFAPAGALNHGQLCPTQCGGL